MALELRYCIRLLCHCLKASLYCVTVLACCLTASPCHCAVSLRHGQREKEVMLQHDMFLDQVASSFHNFVDSTEASCIDRCIEDLTSTTRFVSWTLHHKVCRGGRTRRAGCTPRCYLTFLQAAPES